MTTRTTHTLKTGKEGFSDITAIVKDVIRKTGRFDYPNCSGWIAQLEKHRERTDDHAVHSGCCRIIEGIHRP